MKRKPKTSEPIRAPWVEEDLRQMRAIARQLMGRLPRPAKGAPLTSVELSQEELMVAGYALHAYSTEPEKPHPANRPRNAERDSRDLVAVVDWVLLVNRKTNAGVAKKDAEQASRDAVMIDHQIERRDLNKAIKRFRTFATRKVREAPEKAEWLVEWKMSMAKRARSKRDPALRKLKSVD
jgi:hypothetical protein